MALHPQEIGSQSKSFCDDKQHIRHIATDSWQSSLMSEPLLIQNPMLALEFEDDSDSDSDSSDDFWFLLLFWYSNEVQCHVQSSPFQSLLSAQFIVKWSDWSDIIWYIIMSHYVVININHNS